MRRAVLIGVLGAAAMIAAILADAMLFSPALAERGALETAVLFGIGTLVATPIAWPIASVATYRRQRTAAFAAMLILVLVGSIGAADLAFVLNHLLTTHGATALSGWGLLDWRDNLTAMSYFFAVAGLRLFLPFGLLVVFAIAWVFARTRPAL